MGGADRQGLPERDQVRAGPQFRAGRCGRGRPGDQLRGDGNNTAELLAAFDEAKATKGKPSCIIARTYMGNGVSFMQDKYEWHGKPPSEDQAKVALEELG